MEKIVPIETLTSMFMDPSSGSYSTTYLPAAFPGGTGTGAGSSSDAVTHTRPVCCTLLRTVSFAKRSSFCCRSPETLTAPAAPRISESPARRTWRDRKSTRLNSSHLVISYAVFCLKKKKNTNTDIHVDADTKVKHS